MAIQITHQKGNHFGKSIRLSFHENISAIESITGKFSILQGGECLTKDIPDYETATTIALVLMRKAALKAAQECIELVDNLETRLDNPVQLNVYEPEAQDCPF